MLEDLRWFGFMWREPVITQSGRIPLYRAALAGLHAAGAIFPCRRSRRDVAATTGAPHDGEEGDEPVYPRAFRPPAEVPLPPLDEPGVNWRFRVPDDEQLEFRDGHLGRQAAVSGRDFGDFLVWRKDGVPSYQLASVVDDAELGITEVVRGADLVRSTFRQLLLFRALGKPAPRFCHCPLLRNPQGVRLAKRHDALALRTLRAQGKTPGEIRAAW